MTVTRPLFGLDSTGHMKRTRGWRGWEEGGGGRRRRERGREEEGEEEEGKREEKEGEDGGEEEGREGRRTTAQCGCEDIISTYIHMLVQSLTISLPLDMCEKESPQVQTRDYTCRWLLTGRWW